MKKLLFGLAIASSVAGLAERLDTLQHHEGAGGEVEKK